MGAQLPRHAPSSHRFDFAVTLTIIGILATLLLGYLHKAQNEIEKVIIDTELNSFRLGLTEALISKNIKNESVHIKDLIGSNPMNLLAERPANYIGEFSSSPSDRYEVWYFDTSKKRLVYVFNDGHQVSYKLVSSVENTKAALLTVGGLDLVKDVTEAN